MCASVHKKLYTNKGALQIQLQTLGTLTASHNRTVLNKKRTHHLECFFLLHFFMVMVIVMT